MQKLRCGKGSVIPLTCSLGCFTKHFIEKISYKMVLRQPTSRQQVGTLYEMTSPSSLWNASPQTTRVQRHAAQHRATTQLSSIKCCSNLGVIFEALLQYGKTYIYKMPFPQAVANPSDLIQWRRDVQLVWLCRQYPVRHRGITMKFYLGGAKQNTYNIPLLISLIKSRHPGGGTQFL